MHVSGIHGQMRIMYTAGDPFLGAVDDVVGSILGLDRCGAEPSHVRTREGLTKHDKEK